MRVLVAFVFLCMLVVHSLETSASPVSLITDRNDLGDADVLEWSELGTSGTFVPQPFTLNTDSGIAATVVKNDSNDVYQRLDQGNGWNGNFFPGEALLFSVDPTAFDIRFDPPVLAVGTQIQHENPGPFTAFVRAFSNGEVVAEFSLPGFSDDSANGSAIFVGVRSEGTIDRVLFDSFFGGNTAVNQLSILPVPEPSSLAILAAGICGVVIPGLFRRVTSGRPDSE